MPRRAPSARQAERVLAARRHVPAGGCRAAGGSAATVPTSSGSPSKPLPRIEAERRLAGQRRQARRAPPGRPRRRAGRRRSGRAAAGEPRPAAGVDVAEKVGDVGAQAGARAPPRRAARPTGRRSGPRRAIGSRPGARLSRRSRRRARRHRGNRGRAALSESSIRSNSRRCVWYFTLPTASAPMPTPLPVGSGHVDGVDVDPRDAGRRHGVDVGRRPSSFGADSRSSAVEDRDAGRPGREDHLGVADGGAAILRASCRRRRRPRCRSATSS